MNHAAGWTPTSLFAWVFLAAWLAVVVVYGLWRSRGDAAPDPIRLAGPTD